MLRRLKGGVDGDGGRQDVERRKRYEGEGAWENRGMAQVPFYNSGNVWHVNRALAVTDPQSLRSQCSSIRAFFIFILFFFQIDTVFMRDLVTSPRCAGFVGDNNCIDWQCPCLPLSN